MNKVMKSDNNIYSKIDEDVRKDIAAIGQELNEMYKAGLRNTEKYKVLEQEYHRLRGYIQGQVGGSFVSLKEGSKYYDKNEPPFTAENQEHKDTI